MGYISHSSMHFAEKADSRHEPARQLHCGSGFAPRTDELLSPASPIRPDRVMHPLTFAPVRDEAGIAEGAPDGGRRATRPRRAHRSDRRCTARLRRTPSQWVSSPAAIAFSRRSGSTASALSRANDHRSTHSAFRVTHRVTACLARTTGSHGTTNRYAARLSAFRLPVRLPPAPLRADCGQLTLNGGVTRSY